MKTVIMSEAFFVDKSIINPYLPDGFSHFLSIEPRHAIMCLREINYVMRYDVVKSDVIISRRA